MELPITKEQAYFLNLVARTAWVYRTACDRIQRDMKLNEERIAKGAVPTAIRAYEAADISTAAAQLDTLQAVLLQMFPEADGFEGGRIVRGYFKTAMMLEPGDSITATPKD
jgi:hypothetical protein